MPISAFRCPAPANSRPRPSSSTARRRQRLRGPTLATDFKQMVVDYIERPVGHRGGDGKRLEDVAGLIRSASGTFGI